MTLDITRLIDENGVPAEIKVKLTLDVPFHLDAWREALSDYAEEEPQDAPDDDPGFRKRIWFGPDRDEVAELVRTWVIDGDEQGVMSCLPYVMQQVCGDKGFDQVASEACGEGFERMAEKGSSLDSSSEEAIV